MNITLPGKIDTNYTIETEHGKIIVPANVSQRISQLELDIPLIVRMIAAARHTRENAHAPYTRFSVGAAVVMADDPENLIFSGANIESAVSGLGICAERCAFFSAASAGFRKIKYMVVATQAETGCLSDRTPCGMCRQLISEFSLTPDDGVGKTLVFMVSTDKDVIAEMLDIDCLLPHRFILKSE